MNNTTTRDGVKLAEILEVMRILEQVRGVRVSPAFAKRLLLGVRERLALGGGCPLRRGL